MDSNLLILISVTFVVIAIPIAIIWVSRWYQRRKAIDFTNGLSQEVQRKLQGLTYYEEVSIRERIRYILRNILSATIIFVVIVGIGLARDLVSGDVKAFDSYLIPALIILVFILLFVLRDCLRVAPWLKVYRIKALKYGFATHGEIIVCYYDFVKREYAGDYIAVYSFERRNIASNGEMFDVLVVEKRNRLKVIDILK